MSRSALGSNRRHRTQRKTGSGELDRAAREHVALQDPRQKDKMPKVGPFTAFGPGTFWSSIMKKAFGGVKANG